MVPCGGKCFGFEFFLCNTMNRIWFRLPHSISVYDQLQIWVFQQFHICSHFLREWLPCFCHCGTLKEYVTSKPHFEFLTCTATIWFPSPPLDNIGVMMIVWRLRGNIIRTAPCWVVWHNVRSQQHTHMSSSYRSSRLSLSHWDPYAMLRGGCLELYYCNMVEWCWWDSAIICKTNWFPSVLWHCWFGHMTGKYRPRYDL